jgi:peptide/nickel transport system permease protein
MSDVWRMIAQRLGLGFLTLFVMSLMIFGATELLPGDFAEAVLGQQATPETVAAIRRELGLDQPVHIRYFNWLGGALQGDFGMSLAHRNRPVADMIGTRLGNTLFLALYAAAMAVPLSLALGILAALFRNSPFDRGANAMALTSISFPEFFVAYILIVWLGQARLFPSMARLPAGRGSGREALPHLPARADADAGGDRPHDADDPGRDHQPPGQPLYRDGAAEGHVADAGDPEARAAQRAGPDHQRHRDQPRLPDHRRRGGRGGVRLSRPRPVDGRQRGARDMPVVQAVALIFAAAYVLLNLLADVLSTLSNPRLMHRK